MTRHLVAVGAVLTCLSLIGPAAASPNHPGPGPQTDQLMGTLAFERYQGAANSETGGTYSYLVSLALDGSGEQILTDVDTAQERVPSWSPDGTKLAYTGGHDWDLFVIDREGGEPVQLTSGSRFGDWWPSWSPDGKRMAFYRADYQKGGRRLYSIKADGSDMRALTDGKWLDSAAAWSPDGKWIAFSRYDPSGDAEAGYHIWAVRPDGSGLRRLTAGRLQSSRPAWSPNGKWIAFGGWMREESNDLIASATNDIYVMPAAGGKARPVTTGDAYDMEPCWSPDSSRIAFTRTAVESWVNRSLPSPASNYVWLAYGTPADIYSVRVDGSDLRQITTTPVSEEACTWTE